MRVLGRPSALTVNSCAGFAVIGDCSDISRVASPAGSIHHERNIPTMSRSGMEFKMLKPMSHAGRHFVAPH